ncbi:MAG TPA: alpha/beta fold hydrolase [Vicinamibacterales bacterium]|jgi:pimeloyl-ACP methyl ester carboxylesterase
MRSAALAVVAAAWLAACRSGQVANDVAAAAGLDARPCTGIAATDARCYRLDVPENRSKPSRTIPLHIVVLPSTGSDRLPDPVFFLAGGPGQAASELMHDQTSPHAELRRRRDLVFADQRGTGGSHVLSCPFYGPPDKPQSYFDAFLPIAKVRECRGELERSADLAQYTTAASVEDLEAIRVAMGSPKVNLVGGSYGTRLAMEYVRQYAQHVRTVVLDSPVTPVQHAPEDFGRLAQSAFDKLLDECERTASCAKAFPKLRDESRAVFDRLRAGSVTATVSHPKRDVPAQVTLTRDHVAEAIRYMMYSTRGASQVPLYLHTAFGGDYGPFADFLIRWRADGTFDGLYLSITCAEDVPFIAAGAVERDESTYLGSYRLRQQRAACAEWPRGTPGPRQFEPVTSDVPVLMTTGALDPVTPPANADMLAKTLPHSLHVRIPFSGHSPFGLTGIGCISRIKLAFIERGAVEGLDTTCVSNMARAGFLTTW